MSACPGNQKFCVKTLWTTILFALFCFSYSNAVRADQAAAGFLPVRSQTPQAGNLSPTQTPTVTMTPIPTGTPAWTSTSTNTFSPTQTPTGTLSPSLTPTITHSSTSTSTQTYTPTQTPTGTLSPSLTFTPTGTPTSTSTRTSTSTPTSSPTPTATPGVFQFSVSPKPDDSGLIKFTWGANIKCDSVYLKIYSSGFRLVRSFEFNKEETPDYLTVGTHNFTWDRKDEENRLMPPGIYLCFVDINAGKKRYEASGKTEIP